MLGARGISLIFVSVAVAASCESTPPSLRSPRMSVTAAPENAGVTGIDWRTLPLPDGYAVQLAIARPHGAGPFPTVILIHGTHGFAQEYVRLAHDLSDAGFLAVAPCWFAPGVGEGMRSVTPLPCPPETPALSANLSPESVWTIDAIVRAVRGLPDVHRGQIALFGHSRGAGTALNYAIQTGGVDALVLNSSGYPEIFAASAGRIASPILMLHGEADAPADGGSPMTAVGMARAFEAAMVQAGKVVEAHYYPGGLHTGFFIDPAQRKDEMERVLTFLREHFRS